MNPNDKPAPKPSAPKGRVFDVMRPGRAPAPPTSHPGIIGHAPKVRNTMAGVSGIGEPEPLLNPKKQPAIATFTAPAQVPQKEAAPAGSVAVKAASAEPTATAPPAIPAAASAPAPVVAPAPEAVAATPAAVTAQPVPNAAEPNASAPTPEKSNTPPPPAPDIAWNAPLLHSDALDHGDVVVSHHHRGNSSVLQILLLVLCIAVIIVLALDIALDAGLFRLQGIPHTNFF